MIERTIPKQFPRWRLLRRIVLETEQMLGRLPLLILTPTVGAITATAYAASHPGEVERRGVVTLVHQSFWDALGSALIGGLGGIAVVGALVLLYQSVGYWLWQRRAWTIWLVRSGTGEYASCWLEASNPAALTTIGALAATVKLPSGVHLQGQVKIGLNPYFLMPVEPGPERYDVRWYATPDRSRQYELTRSRILLRPREEPNCRLGSRSRATPGEFREIRGSPKAPS